MARIPVTVRTSTEDVDLLRGPVNFSDEFFGFLEEGDTSPESSFSSGEGDGNGYSDDDVDEISFDVKESKAFWDSQDELLQTTLRRTGSIELRIRRATKDILRELSIESTLCGCRRPLTSGCRNCWQREICNRLRFHGFNSSICKSKWKPSSDIPSGEHSYLEVVDNSNPKKGEMRVIIELNFRAEFEMARASEEYNKLVCRLPEVFVGKLERIRCLIKILCSAAKRCTKEKKMHLAPWRKHKYMQSKWLGKSERAATSSLPTSFVHRPTKSKASMLTFDLLDNLPGLHCKRVEVV